MMGQGGKVQKGFILSLSSLIHMIIPFFLIIPCSYDVWFHNNYLLFSLYLTAVC